MPKWWDRLDDREKKMLTYGAPAVAAVAAFSIWRDRGADLEEEPPPAAHSASPPPAVASTDVIGSSQLASFESSVTERLSWLTEQILANRQADAEEDVPQPGPTKKKPAKKKEPAPTAPKTEEPTTAPTGRTAKPGYDRVVDNRGAEFVVSWSARVRARVSNASLRQKAQQSFGSPLTSLSQTPNTYQSAVAQWFKKHGWKFKPDGPIYLDSRIPGGWKETTWDGKWGTK